MPYANREEKVLNNVSGHIWAAKADDTVIRNEGSLLHPRFRRMDFCHPARNGIPLRRHAPAQRRLRPGRLQYRYLVSVPS